MEVDVDDSLSLSNTKHTNGSSTMEPVVEVSGSMVIQYKDKKNREKVCYVLTPFLYICIAALET